MPEQSNNPVRDKAEAFRLMVKEKAGIHFDYSMFALVHLDLALNDLIGKNIDKIQKPEFDNFRKELTLQLGFFIGECLRETFSGIWESDPQLGICLKRIGNQDITAFPLSTAADCIKGEKGKVFAVTQLVCAEVFKKVRERYYSQS